MEWLTESESEEKRNLLEDQLKIDPTQTDYDYKSTHINWIEENEEWEVAKYKAKEIMFDNWLDKGVRGIVLAYPKDTIVGKPQLVYQTKQKIILLRARASQDKDKSVHKTIKFFDEPYDKRYDGIMTYELAMDFWVYRIQDQNKEFYVLTKEEMPLEKCEVRGMNVETSDLAELKKTMKLRALSNVFIAKEFNKVVKVVSKESLIDLTKEIGFSDWVNYINYHPLNTINTFPEKTNLIRSVQLLSGKIDGWPMHLSVIGPAGTRKSKGWLETTSYKFSQEIDVVEGANSTLKVLSPSFKEKPANIGKIAQAERMCFIDELGKMVEKEMNKHQTAVTNVLGEINFLLDHSRRTVGSGNDNNCLVQATAKCLFATNPVRGRDYLEQHIGLIDPTTMSRILWWVQDDEEQDHVMSNEGIIRLPPTPTQAYSRGDKDKEDKSLVMVLGEKETEVQREKTQPSFPMELSCDDFLTIYDSCNSFLCELSDDLIDSLVKNSINRSKEPLRSIWKPRAEHHVRLLVDGLCKIRCLFVDHKNDFVANDKDYALASEMLDKIISSWYCKLTIKDMTGGKL